MKIRNVVFFSIVFVMGYFAGLVAVYSNFREIIDHEMERRAIDQDLKAGRRL